MSSTLDDIRGWLPGRLADAAAEHKVPGVAMAVLAGDEIAEATTGVTSKATGVDVTTDTVFQIGSITKVWTASLIMQLSDEGLLDLEAPVRTYLPQFRVADEQASAEITVRQLTCHVSGFEGDIFTDTGRGDDAVEKYLATITEVPQLFPPGERFSYNNAAYVVLGRIVEVLREKPYGAALREHLATPLGLQHLATDAYEAILHRAAVGHVEPEPGADPVPAPVWALAASNAPAGSLLSMSAADLIAFARMHLAGGTAADGTRVLSESAVHAMRERQVELPYLGLLGDAWGIGWEIFDWAGGPGSAEYPPAGVPGPAEKTRAPAHVIGHDGGTIGQNAFLRIVPEQNIAVAMLTNGGNPMPLYNDVFGRVLAELADVHVPEPLAPPAEPEPVRDAERYVGRYAADIVVYDVEIDDDGRLWQQMTPKGVLAEAGQHGQRYEIVRLRDDTFVSREPQDGISMPTAFVGFDGDGRAGFLHQGRAIPRVDQ